MKQASKQPQNAPQGPCYNCKSYDHWARDCPSPKQPRPPPTNPTIPTLARYYLECGITHLVADCPHNPDKKGKDPLNTMNVIPSLETTHVPSEEESDGVKPMNVVTQAQARNNPMINKETQMERSLRNTKQGDTDKRPLKLANFERKTLNLTMKLSKNNNKRKNIERDQSL